MATPLRAFDFRQTSSPLSNYISFSRGSEASYYGSDGYLHFSGTGSARLAAAQDFVPNAWNKVGTVATVPSNIVDPDGTKAATKLTESNVSGEHRMSQSLTVVKGSPVTISIYVKAGTRNAVQFSFLNAASYTGGNPGAKYDLSTGKIISKSTNVISANAVEVEDGWWKLSLTGLPDLGTASGLHLYMLDDRNSISYSGNTGKYVYAYGAQYETAAELPEAAPAATVSGLRYNYDLSSSTPKLVGALIEPAGTNLVPYSQLLTHASWRKQYSTLITASGKAPDGSATVFKIKEDNSRNSQHYIMPNPTIASSSGSVYTFSAFMKAAERKWAFFNINGVTVHFDLVNGVVGSKHSMYTSTSVESAGNGWFRCSATYTSAVSSTSAKIGPEPGNATPTYNGDGNSGVLIWGAQLEKSDKVTSYIRTQSGKVSRSADVVTLTRPAGSANDVFVQRSDGGIWLNDMTSSYQVTTAATEIQVANFYGSTETISSKDATAESLFPFKYGFVGLNNTLTTIYDSTYLVQTPNKTWNVQRAVNKTSPVFRFQINAGDKWAGDLSNPKDKERCELYLKNGDIPFNQDVWLSYAIRIAPGKPIIVAPDEWCLLGQFHASEDKGDLVTGPMLGFRLENEDTVKAYTASTLENPTKSSPKYIYRATGTFTRGVWHRVVLRMRFSPTNGQLQWWQNGKQLINLSGIGMGYPDQNGPYWKFGIYRFAMAPTLVVEYANMELKYGSSLQSRVTNPLTIA